VSCLQEFDPGCKESALFALGYIARHNAGSFSSSILFFSSSLLFFSFSSFLSLLFFLFFSFLIIIIINIDLI
jgi:hypothetical protein